MRTKFTGPNAKVRRLMRFLHQHGLEVKRGKTHYLIFRDGEQIMAFSGTASCPHFADRTIKNLVKAGYLPETVKHVKIH